MGLGALGIMYDNFFAEKLGNKNIVFADQTGCKRYAASRVTYRYNGYVKNFVGRRK